MENIKKARARLRHYPVLITKCSVPAKAYAVCVTSDLKNVNQNACANEFNAFKQCMKDAAKNLR